GFAIWAVRVPPTLTLILKIHSQGFCFPLLSPPLGAALCYICMALHAQAFCVHRGVLPHLRVRHIVKSKTRRSL
ncbi:MAG: hypothetical protein RSC40_08250, partial [Clostridia bacterium]